MISSRFDNLRFFVKIHRSGTWNTAISPSKSLREGLFHGEVSPSVVSIPGGHRKSQSGTPITPSSGASGVGRTAWLGELEELWWESG